MQAQPLTSPTLSTAALAALETVINQALVLDPATSKKLAKFDGHVFLIRCLAPAFNIYFIPELRRVRLCNLFDGKPDTTLIGHARDFTRLATSADSANVLVNSELELHGDSQALISLQAIAKELDIDWEAPLSRIFGDVLGHQLGRNLRHSFRFTRQLAGRLKVQLDDYLLQESDLLPPSWQVERFFNDVDQLNLRTERLQAKIDRLKQQRSRRP